MMQGIRLAGCVLLLAAWATGCQHPPHAETSADPQRDDWAEQIRPTEDEAESDEAPRRSELFGLSERSRQIERNLGVR